MQFWLTQHGYSKIEVEKQVLLIAQALKQAISSAAGAWLFVPRASTQTELSITTINENNQPQEQRIDLTFIENNERWIIDFKLGLEVTAANANIAALSHKLQLERYTKLFTHENLSIKTAVFFLSLGSLIEV
jgi:hypothetical protein